MWAPGGADCIIHPSVSPMSNQMAQLLSNIQINEFIRVYLYHMHLSDFICLSLAWENNWFLFPVWKKYGQSLNKSMLWCHIIGMLVYKTLSVFIYLYGFQSDGVLIFTLFPLHLVFIYFTTIHLTLQVSRRISSCKQNTKRNNLGSYCTQITNQSWFYKRPR